jgi:hypothetical protein
MSYRTFAVVSFAVVTFAVVTFVAVMAATVTATSIAAAQAPDARATLTAAAKALGMVRGLERSLTIVNMFEYTAKGTMAGMMTDAAGAPGQVAGQATGQVNRITAAYDYVIPAARVDIERASAGGPQRTIEVASGALAWDESTPGIYLRPAATSAAERLKLIWLLPHGVILAAAKAPDKISVAEKDGLRELTVPLQTGAEAKGVLDAADLMTHVEIKIGAQLFTGDYADYKDFQGYGVMFPTRIVQKVDGRTIADLTVSEALANPYMIFPPPKELKQLP